MKVPKVLLVEDDSSFAQLLTRWLQRERNCNTVTISDGALAARSMVEENWDLVISDVNLPGIGGLDLVRECKEHAPQTPVLLMTAHESVECVIRALQNRADDFLVKPFNRETLIEKIDKLLSLRVRNAPRPAKTVLAIGAHPDDVEIGCGGLLARHHADGDQICILTLSEGTQGGPHEIRRRESEAAAAQLNARLFWGGLEDTQISEGFDTIRAIETVITQVNPSAIYSHSKNDGHQDHRNAHLATLVAARRVPSLSCYQSPSSTIGFQPNRFVEIQDFFQQKIDLIGSFKTQTSKCAYLETDLIHATARYWGRFAGNHLVEPLEVIRESH